ncbi:hypothetical protein NDU88_009382 [Pleurodeles waltl]|uniref:Uncharacterized protein n=1 Tax=Pleurodeles waltl TaxID=8319 RepID=A0AAV7PT46_PLEWA|nr:hypothetical protein NDU88_009382 [Pleurodeles waltl]
MESSAQDMKPADRRGARRLEQLGGSSAGVSAGMLLSPSPPAWSPSPVLACRAPLPAYLKLQRLASSHQPSAQR